jgi:ABC-type dipeptide/oligopeptide/nickel transport system ATPase component
VEAGPTESVARTPKHPVTMRLMAAAKASNYKLREQQVV